MRGFRGERARRSGIRGVAFARLAFRRIGREGFKPRVHAPFAKPFHMGLEAPQARLDLHED